MRQFPQSAAPPGRICIPHASITQSPQSDEWRILTGTLQLSFFIPPRWGKGTLFGPHFHGFDLILKSISVIYLVGLTSPCRRQRLRRVGFKYPLFSSKARSRRSWIGFVATRSRLRVRVPRWSSYILLHVSCAVGLRAMWFDSRLGSVVAFHATALGLHKIQGFSINRSTVYLMSFFLPHRYDIRRSTRFCECAST